jgi:hypothetical protein
MLHELICLLKWFAHPLKLILYFLNNAEGHTCVMKRERERRNTPIISLDLITNVINFHSNYKRKLSSHVIITESLIYVSKIEHQPKNKHLFEIIITL